MYLKLGCGFSGSFFSLDEVFAFSTGGVSNRIIYQRICSTEENLLYVHTNNLIKHQEKTKLTGIWQMDN